MKVEKFPRLTRAIAALSAGVILLALVMAPAAMAAETPRYGGILNFAVGKGPPSFDCHRETTFACIHPMAPFYSLLLKFDQWNYPKVVGDVAKSWKVSKDGKTYTFKIRKGIKFHDGSTLTARDVKATYDKIISPPPMITMIAKANLPKETIFHSWQGGEA